MILTTTQKFFIVLVLVFILGFLAYSTVGTNSEESAGGTTTVQGGTINGADILTLVERFKTVSIKKDVFDTSLFKSLTDFTTPLTAEPQGRPNPFAPIGFDNFGTTQTQTSTSTTAAN